MSSVVRILGIDPGYATIGFAVLEKNGQKVHIIDFGVITTPADMLFQKRLKSIADDIAEIMTKFTPDFMAIEKLFWGANVDNAMGVAQARGVILLQAAKQNIPIREFSPNEVKSQLVGNGKAPKFQIQNILKMRLGLAEIPKPDDAADALAIALIASEANGF
ncbi:MAG: crossover junction endodeoxyribonuclease RuvC [Candidatus Peregrinibacteria bacterium]